MRSLPITLGLAALLAGGCDGGDERDDGPQPLSPRVQKALRHLPATPEQQLAAVDLVAAKEELGMRPDAPLGDVDGQRGRMLAAVSTALPYFAAGVEVSPLSDGIDSARIQAAARSGATRERGSIAVVVTDQSFGQVEDFLRTLGYKRRRDLLVSVDPQSDVTYTMIAPGPGVMVLGNDAAAVRAALARGAPDPRLRPLVGLLERLDSPARVATRSRGPGCVRETAFGDAMRDRADGELVAELATPAESSRIALGGLPPQVLELWSVEERRTDGARAEAELRARKPLARLTPLSLGVADVPTPSGAGTARASVYRCPP